MCLPIKIHRPDCVLAEGQHLGFEWAVVHNLIGFRCGYVRVPPGHPWHGKDNDNIDPPPDVHGGLTFAQADLPCDKGLPDNGWWVGFDCAHCGDAQDPALPADYPMGWHGEIRDQAYVEAQCRSLCEQAAATMPKQAA